MFDPTSRYAKLPIKLLVDDQGREVAYVSRRMIPDAPRLIARMVVEAGDRLDLIANRAYGDPRAFWRVLDANPLPDPLELADQPGRRIHLSQPEEG
jgi:hypothetical protein